jgi:hypothetical protein
MWIGIRIRMNANLQNFSHRTLIRILIALLALYLTISGKQTLRFENW